MEFKIEKNGNVVTIKGVIKKVTDAESIIET
jgi:hypothetical protein